MKRLKPLSEKQVLLILVTILIITTIADMYTAFSSPIFKIGETNPIYVYTNSIWPLVALTILLTSYIINNLRKRLSLFKIFIATMMTLYLSLGHSFGAWSNITSTEEYYEDPELFVERIETITVSQKVEIYFILVGIVMLMPIFISGVAFVVAFFIYNKRKPVRDKITDKIYELAVRLKTK